MNVHSLEGQLLVVKRVYHVPFYFVTTVLTVPLSFEFFNVADLTIEND